MSRWLIVSVLSTALLLLVLGGGACRSVAQPAARAAATCSDHATQAEAQRAADTSDADGDGIYCESLPCPCSSAQEGGGGGSGPSAGSPEGCRRTTSSVRVRFSRRRWPNIADHIADVRRRYPLVLHIDRAGADRNREEALEGIPTREGYDRDEYPPAIAREGGASADVRYVRSRENRSAGSHLGNRPKSYCDRQPFRMLVTR